MSRRARSLRIIQLRWVARFGEPPPILTDPELMLSILNSAGERQDSPGQETSGDTDQAPSRIDPAR
jgi:hypothetical protein